MVVHQVKQLHGHIGAEPVAMSFSDRLLNVST